MRTTRLRLRHALLAVAVAAAGWPARSLGAEYTLAVVPRFEQRRLLETWRPIAAELERRTGHRIRIVSSIAVQDFEGEFTKGRWDLVYMNPYMIARTRRTLGYVPLVRDRAPTRGVVIVRKGSPLRKLQDLAGKQVAFPAPNAVGGCMLIRAELAERFGLDVQPVFAKTASNVVLLVAKGLADAGGVPAGALKLADPALRERLEVIHATRDVPSSPIAAHPRIPAEERERIRGALLELAATDAGRALFARVPMEDPVPAGIEEYAAMERWGLERWYEPRARSE